MRPTYISPFQTRQYMLSRDFELYYYSDSALTHVDDHAHNYWEFYLFLEGDVDMYIGGQPQTLVPGEIVVIPPETMHHAVIRPSGHPYRRFVFWISRDFTGELTEQSPDYLYLMQRATAGKEYFFPLQETAFHRIQTSVFSLLEEINSRRYGRAPRIRVLVEDLVLNMNRAVYESRHPTERPDRDPGEEIRSYIEEHLSEDLTIDRLARKFYVSSSYISHLFRDTLGISVHQYILKKRLSRCKDAILNGEDAGSACLSAGFGDYSSFYRAFVREYGQPPSKYQAAFRETLREKQR